MASSLYLGPAPAAPPGRLSRELAALEALAGGKGSVDVIVSFSSPPGSTKRERIRGLGGGDRGRAA